MALLLLIAPAHAAAPKSVELVPKWKQGDSFRVTVTKGREQARGGQPATKSSNTSEEQITVLEATPAGYVLRVATIKAGNLTGPRVNARQADALQKLSEQYVLDVEVDREARVKGLRNWDEVQKAVNEASDVLLKETPPAEAEKVRGLLKQMFGDRSRAEPLLLRDVTLLLAPLGREYVVGEAITYEDVLPNPFGGKPFPAIGSFTLQSIEGGVAKVAFRQTLDPQQTSAILRESMAKVVQGMGATRPATLPIEDFQINDSADFEIDLATGMPRRMRHQREMKGMGGTRIDSMQVELQR